MGNRFQSVSPRKLKWISPPDCVSFISPRRPNSDSGRFFLLCLLTFFTFPLSTLPPSKWYFVVTKSHYSNVFINIYDEVWGRPVEVFCFHLSACCNYPTECERCRERRWEIFLTIHLKGKLFTHIDRPDNPPESTLHFTVSSVWHVYRWFIFVCAPAALSCCLMSVMLDRISHVSPVHQPPDHLLQHPPPQLHLIGSSDCQSSLFLQHVVTFFHLTVQLTVSCLPAASLILR